MVGINLPNKLTMLRIWLIVPFVGLVAADSPVCYLLSAIIFAIASLTDLFDGWYARKHNMVTDFGKLMDPIADKLLVMAALVVLVARDIAPWLASIVLFAREYIISGVRLVAASKGVVIAADKYGKLKTFTQMLGIVCYLLGGWTPGYTLMGEILIWISVALSVLSLIGYVKNNKEVFK